MTAGFKVEPTTGLQTTETGQTATFRISLNTAPTSDVRLTLASSDPSEGDVSPTQITFNAMNWNAEQVVTITGKDDNEPDGNQNYKITFAPADSTDPEYTGKKPADLDVVNIDNETANVIFTGITDLKTSEPNGTATFQVSLSSAPTQDVRLDLSSSDTAEVTVVPASVIFTPTDWNAAHTVTLTGVDDTEVDGPQQVTIVTAPLVSGDSAYNGIDTPDINVTNEDDDAVIFIVRPTSGLVTHENGTQASFTVRLNTPPPSNVTVAVAPAEGSEGEIRVSPATLTFTPDDWRSPHPVLVTGLNDDEPDMNQPFTVALAPSVSTTPAFNGVDPPDVTGINIDDDTPGITVVADPDLELSENGGQASFYVILNKQPSSDVSIGVASSNTEKATVSPATLVFTELNWNAPHAVTITGVNNTIKDGRQPVNIVLAAAVSDDEGYAGIDPQDVTVHVIDDDGPGLTIVTAEDFTTNEQGKQTTFTVRLNSKPTANVTIPLVSDDPGEIIVSPASLIFTVNDWNSPHTVTLTGVNDELLDDDQEVDIRLGPSTSSDPDYLNLPQQIVTALNIDDDTAGVTVTPVAGLVTSESGLEDTFTVVLNHPPTNDVTFTLSVTNPDEATVGPSTLTFTAANWNAPQVVTLTGQDDAVAIADGRQLYRVVFSPAMSTDPKYSGLIVPDVLAANNDNDTPGVTVTPVAGNMTTTEAGGQATFNVVLDSQPTQPVTLTVVSATPSEGTASPTTLVFDSVNWSAPQLVTVTGADDDVDDGPQPYVVVLGPATSDDVNYEGLVVANVNLTNTDDDTAGVTVNPPTAITTNEAGGQATFTVRLNSEPTGAVTIPIASSRPGEATVSPASLTFTPGAAGNWNSTQTVTVTGVGDLTQDGNQTYNINFGPITGDPKYAALMIPSIEGTNVDNDSPQITVIANNLRTTELGGQATFSITLGAQPSADVTIPITVSRPAEAQIVSTGLVTTLNVTFTSVNYNALRDITLQGVDDLVADGNQPYKISIGPAVSTDPNYAGRVLPSIDAINEDNETASIKLTGVDANAPFETDEFGAAGAHPSFTVELTSEPTDTVTIPLSVTDTTEGSVSPMSLVFTPASWGPQTVTLEGVNDDIADGSQPYFVVIGPSVSNDPNYNAKTVPNVAAFNTDNDYPGITVEDPIGGPVGTLTTSEDSNAPPDTFRIRLNSEPTADVTITIASTVPTEASIDNPTLTFTAANWSAWQTVTVRGVNDDVADLDQPFQVTITAASADANYVRTVPNLSGVNADDDTAGFTLVGDGSLQVQEPSTTDSFTIRLRSQPTSPVTIPLASSDTTEFTVAPVELVFTQDNWDEPQTVTITAVDDLVADGTRTPNVLFGPVTGDPTYAALTISSRAVTVLDDDSAAVILSKSAVNTFEVGTEDTFTIVLNSEPSAPTTITISSSDVTEAVVSPASVTFDGSNWSTPVTVTVAGVQDTPVAFDGDVDYTIQLGAPTGASEYAVLGSRTIAGKNWEAFLHCREVQEIHPTATSGVYWLDADRAGTLAKFRAYCDLDTAGGGWTLLSWTANSATQDGLPYPGLAYCTSPTYDCERGSGVPSAAAATALFTNASELGQGQAITAGAEKTTFENLGDYEYAGTFMYSSLAGLTAAETVGPCTGLLTGTYTTISDVTDPARNDNTVVYLNQSLRLDDSNGDYSNDANSYTWSIGNRTGHCATNGTPPASVVGTWQAAQYGPAFQNAAGSYSVWVR